MGQFRSVDPLKTQSLLSIPPAMCLNLNKSPHIAHPQTMGNCLSGNGETRGGNDAFVPTNTSNNTVEQEEHVEKEEHDIQALRRRRLGKNNRARPIESIIRVGSRVFRPDPFPSHSNKAQDGVPNGHLEQHKASTYDHVHQMVSHIIMYVFFSFGRALTSILSHWNND